MDSSSSVQREPGTAMGYRLRLVSKAKRLFASSPAKEKPSIGEEKRVSGFGVQSRDFGSKEDIFVDTQAWLESDCEDDFFSVNGEFTPSRGSTPGRYSNAALSPYLEKTFSENFPVSKSEPSPTGRKRLVELFSESLEHKGDGDLPNADEENVKCNPKLNLGETNPRQPLESLNGTPNSYGASSAACSNLVTPSSDLKIRKEKAWKTGHCCLPSLHAFTSDERRQKMSPKPCTA